MITRDEARKLADESIFSILLQLVSCYKLLLLVLMPRDGAKWMLCVTHFPLELWPKLFQELILRTKISPVQLQHKPQLLLVQSML